MTGSLLAIATLLARLFSADAFAQDAGVIIFDTSGSMGYTGSAKVELVIKSFTKAPRESGGQVTRLEHAKREALKVLERFQSRGYDVSLIIFGQAGCGPDAISQTVPFGAKNAYRLVREAIEFSRPRGATPLSESISLAERSIQAAKVSAKEVVLVTDGIETCKGDPVGAATQLHDSTGATLSVVGLDTDGGYDEQLRAIARAGGGTYEGIKAVGGGGDVGLEPYPPLNLRKEKPRETKVSPSMGLPDFRPKGDPIMPSEDRVPKK